MSHLTLVYSATPAALLARAAAPATRPARRETAEEGFSSKDLIALTCWTQRSDAHGYRRMLLEGGTSEGGPEEGGYALIYAPGQDWASWGLARNDMGVTVWHCGSGSDLGCHATMLQALDSLPPVLAQQQPSRKRAAAAGRAARSPVARLAWAGRDQAEAIA